MSKKKSKTPLLKSIWHPDGITDPYQVIAEFFSAQSLYNTRKHLFRIVDTAYSYKSWKGENPEEVLYDMDKLESLFNAAWMINKERKTTPITFNRSDDLNPNLFYHDNGSYNAWDQIPRSLSYKEYQDPYRAFRTIFKRRKLDKWLHELREITRMALSKDYYAEFSASPSHFLLHHLYKLVEAAHLINIREINHVGGRIKSRIRRTVNWG